MTKETLIKISSYSAIIGLLLIVLSYMIIDVELPWAQQVSGITQIVGFVLFGTFVSILLYAYVVYKKDGLTTLIMDQSLH